MLIFFILKKVKRKNPPHNGRIIKIFVRARTAIQALTDRYTNHHKCISIAYTRYANHLQYYSTIIIIDCQVVYYIN